MEPPALPGGVGRRLILIVLGEETPPRIFPGVADQQFAGAIWTSFFSVFSNNAHLHIRTGTPQTVLPHLARFVIGADHRTGAGLGHSPGLDQREAEAPLEWPMQTWIDASTKSKSHLMIPVSHRRWCLHQDRLHYSQIMKASCPAFPHTGPPTGRVKTIERNQTAACHHHCHHRACHCVHVKHRQGRDHPFSISGERTQATGIVIPTTRVEKIKVRQHTPFGLTGGAGGVEHGGFALQGPDRQVHHRFTTRRRRQWRVGGDDREVNTRLAACLLQVLYT